MAITCTFSDEDGILTATARGSDDSPRDVEEHGISILKEAIARNCSRVLCDDRELTYRLSALNTHQAATQIAQIAPHIARVALVPRQDGRKDAEYWTTVATNRGLMVRTFADIGEARAWLKEQICFAMDA